MNPTWQSEPPTLPRTGVAGAAVAMVRVVPMAILIFGGLAFLLLLRLLERPIFGEARPWTPWITQGVCRGTLKLFGLSVVVEGRSDPAARAVVANHSSWLDIFVLNALQKVCFVSKSEVAQWPGIGWLARATGTVFIERNRQRALDHGVLLQGRLRAGHRLLFFPEGTSSDGRRVLRFKSTLFSAFVGSDGVPVGPVQPVSVIYQSPQGRDPRFYGWWGDMEFGGHFLKVLAQMPQGRVTVVFHPSVNVDGDRKSVAARCEALVRSGVEPRL